MIRVSPQELKDWELHVQRIKSATTVDPGESSQEKLTRIEKAKQSYSFFFNTYFPHYCEKEAGNPDAGYIPLARFHIESANYLRDNRKAKLAKELYRSSAKSVHSDIGEPLWLMIQDEMKFMVLVSDTEAKAKVLLASVQAELQHNERFINDYGKQISHGDWSDGFFSTRKGCMFAAIGIGQSPRGLRRGQTRPDYIVVDDADTKERCRNPRRVREAVEWVLEDLKGCFDAKDGARERLVIANNRIAKNTILGGVIKGLKDIIHSRVNAVNEFGQPSWPEKTSLAYWNDLRAQVPHRSFEREYMNNPIEDGAIFKGEWIQYKKPLPLSEYEAIVSYGDLSYRKSGDYKAIVIIGKIGKEYHILKVFCRKSSIDTAVRWLYDVHESLPEGVVISHYIEGSFIQDGFLDDFDEEGDRRGYYLTVLADKRSKPDKFLRIENMSALWERGWVYYNEDEHTSADMETLVDQTLAFEQGSGANDDGPDACEGGIFILNRRSASKSFKPVIGERRTGFFSKFKW